MSFLLRPATAVLFTAVLLSLAWGLLSARIVTLRDIQDRQRQALSAMVKGLGASDLSLTTEARYIRHLSVSDRLVPFMDHPGGLDHFPSTAFFPEPLP